MDLSEGPGGKIRLYFGHPIAAQKEWIKEHQDRKVPEQLAEDVYWKYVQKAGEEAANDAVLSYFDSSAVVEILLERIDADELDEYLSDNLLGSEPGMEEKP
jgi:hypothetical protein